MANYSELSFEEEFQKKKGYISMRNIEEAENVKEFLMNLIDRIRNKQNVDDLLVNKNTIQTLSQIFTGKNLDSKFSIIESSLYEEGCKHRIDLSIDNIKSVNYRFLILSCDGPLKLQEVVSVEKNISDFRKYETTTKLFVTMYDINEKFIGNLDITLVDIKTNQIKLSGTLMNLTPYANKNLGIHVHSIGDLTNQCKNCGSHFNPLNQFHGGTSGERHLGDFGNIKVDGNGIANISTIVELPKNIDPFSALTSFAGRSIVLHDREDDLGKGTNNESALTGNSGSRIACGVIGGLFLL